MNKFVDASLVIVRNVGILFAMLLVISTVIFGILMTNSEIKFAGMLAIKSFVTGCIAWLIHGTLTRLMNK